jgi:hypothetical protein
MAVIYGNGAAMGFTPQQVDAMSIWQFNAAWSGWIKSKGPVKETLSDEQADELFDWLERDSEPKPVAAGFTYDAVTREQDGWAITALSWGGGQVDAFQAVQMPRPDTSDDERRP